MRSNANLRSGPGTTYGIVGTAPAGQELEIAGVSSDGLWFALLSGQWIFAELVSNPPDRQQLQTVSGPPVATAAPVVATPAPAVEIAPTPVAEAQRYQLPPSDCACSNDQYNCADFPAFLIEGDLAQACYLRCMEQVGRDIHRLDGDKDGLACEWSGWD